jgi:hypothetical protein
MSPGIALRMLWKYNPLNLVLARLISYVRRDTRKKNLCAEEFDNPVVTKSEPILSMVDVLAKMGDRQALLTENLKIRSDLLINIQSELLKESKRKSIYSDPKSPEDEIADLTIETIRELGLFTNNFEEKDFQFMLRIGWKLAQYNIGLSQELETDSQYPAMKAELVKQATPISSEEMNNALTSYLTFSFGMNSAYLYYSRLLATSKVKMSQQPKLSPSRIKHLRDSGLAFLLDNVRRSME